MGWQKDWDDRRAARKRAAAVAIVEAREEALAKLREVKGVAGYPVEPTRAPTGEIVPTPVADEQDSEHEAGQDVPPVSPEPEDPETPEVKVDTVNQVDFVPVDEKV
jgi:hypothetical protein